MSTLEVALVTGASRGIGAAVARRTQDALAGMMTADDVADVVLFVLTRPRNHRMLETALRPMTQPSWG
jgi:NADP-dependent 3-hydroxy acid dehydrogenase YdfG